MRCRRLSSLTACLCTSSGMPASSIAFFSSSSSAALSPPSPSSFWIWRICSRSTCSRWRSSNSLVFSPISLEMRSTPTRSERCSSTLSRRRLRSKVSSRSCLSSFLMSSRLATMSASSAGELMPCTTTVSSSGALGSSEIASTACALSWRKRASSSGSTPPSLDDLDARHQERPALQELEHAEAALALHHEVMRGLGAGDVAHHLAGGADPVEVLGLDVVLLRVALEQEADLLLAAHRFLRGGDRDGAAHGRARSRPGTAPCSASG